MGTFRCELKKTANSKGLTQEQLGSWWGKAGNHHALEAGKYNPSLKLAVDISRAVEAPIEESFFLTDPTKKGGPLWDRLFIFDCYFAAAAASASTFAFFSS